MGGNAFSTKVRRINKSEINPTLDWLADQTGFDAEYLKASLLGSAGKKPDSGDIDINMDENKFKATNVLNILKTFLPSDQIKDRTSVNQVFSCIPISGDPKNGFVQIDFMIGDYEWQKFSYFSGDDAYKGLFRTELIKALVAFKSDWVYSENGKMVARAGPTFFHDHGIIWRYRHRPFKKRSDGRVKALSELDEFEFHQFYPDAPYMKYKQSKDVNWIMNWLLPDAEPVDFETFDSLWTEITYQYGSDLKMIALIYLERLNSLKVIIPETIYERIESARKLP